MTTTARTVATVGGVRHSGKTCENCGTSYRRCTTRVLSGNGPCCVTCGDTDTHDEVLDFGTRLPTADATAERLKADLAAGEQPPDYPVGTVLRFSVRYEDLGKVYQYAALYIGGHRWYTTARFDSAEHFQPTMVTASLMRALLDTGAFDLAVASSWTVVDR